MDWINWIMELAGSFQQMSLSGARIDTQTLSQQALETEIWGGLRVLMISQMICSVVCFTGGKILMAIRSGL